VNQQRLRASRRKFLTSIGATTAMLPFLRILPGYAAGSSSTNLILMFSANGRIRHLWGADDSSGSLVFRQNLAPLQPIAEHVLVYAPLRMQLRDGEKNWWVLLIWHVRPKEECLKLPKKEDMDSCLALLELSDLDPSQYAERVPELLSRVKYPYMQPSATKSHNGIIHGVIP